jgi:hypothetical protein
MRRNWQAAVRPQRRTDGTILGIRRARESFGAVPSSVGGEKRPAFLSYQPPVLFDTDRIFIESYDTAAKMAQNVSPWLTEQFNRTLAQEQAEMERNRPMPPNSDTGTGAAKPRMIFHPRL